MESIEICSVFKASMHSEGTTTFHRFQPRRWSLVWNEYQLKTSNKPVWGDLGLKMAYPISSLDLQSTVTSHAQNRVKLSILPIFVFFQFHNVVYLWLFHIHGELSGSLWISAYYACESQLALFKQIPKNKGTATTKPRKWSRPNVFSVNLFTLLAETGLFVEDVYQ